MKRTDLRMLSVIFTVILSFGMLLSCEYYVLADTPTQMKYIINTPINNTFTSSSSFKSTISVTKQAATTESMNLILCLYNDQGVLKAVTTFTRNLAVGDTNRFYTDFDISASSKYYLKTFIFDDFKTLKPLAVSVKCDVIPKSNP